MKVEPQKEHHWLKKLVGEWSYEHEMPPEPGKPAEKFVGTETVRMLGEVWALCEGRGPMPGGGMAVTQMTLGYDPAKKKFIGSFIGSMMTHLWVYGNGELDAAGKKLTLEAEGPGFADTTKMAKYKDMIEFVNDDHRTLTSHIQGEDGKWTEFMTANYRRTK